MSQVALEDLRPRRRCASPNSYVGYRTQAVLMLEPGSRDFVPANLT